MVLPTCDRVCAERLSESGRERFIFICATSSPVMVRNFSPAASSVVNISGRAVESHAASGRDVEFLKLSTATVRRRFRGAVAISRGGLARKYKYENAPTISSSAITPASTTAGFILVPAGVLAGAVIGVAGGIGVEGTWEI